MNEQQRERLILRYLSALDRGDLDALASILKQAERDSELTRMIVEVNGAYEPGPPSAFSSNGSGRAEKERHMSAFAIAGARPRWERAAHGPALAGAVALGLLLVAVLAVITGYWSLPSAPLSGILQQSEQDVNLAAFMRYLDEAWNAGDVAMLGDVLTGDHVRHEAGLPDMTGVEAIAGFITGFRGAIPDAQFTIADISAVGDRVWARTTGTGTQTGPMALGDGTVIPPSGNSVHFEATSVSRFVDGKMAEIWVTSDALSLLTPMGAIAPVADTVQEAQNEATIRALFDVLWMQGRWREVESFYPYRFALHMPPHQSAMEPRAIWGRDVFQRLHAVTEDLNVTLDSLVAQRDFVSVTYTVTGRQVGDMMTPLGNWIGPEASPRIDYSGAILYRLVDGKVAEEWWHWDNPNAAVVDAQFPGGGHRLGE